MRWTERQRAMLGAMGIELFERVRPDGAGAVALVVAGVRPIERVVDARPVASGPSSATLAPALEEADWVVVGEPIDDAADPTGAQPQLLDNLLRAIGAARIADSRNGRAVFVAASADAASKTHVRAAIEAARPFCVLALGRVAAQALLAGDEPLGTLRGQRHAIHGVPVIVSCSLAFLLRHPDEKARVWAELCTAVRIADEAAAAAAC